MIKMGITFFHFQRIIGHIGVIKLFSFCVDFNHGSMSPSRNLKLQNK